MWGMPNDPNYASKMATKQQLAKKHHLTLVELTVADLPRLANRFAPWLQPIVGFTSARTAAISLGRCFPTEAQHDLHS